MRFLLLLFVYKIIRPNALREANAIDFLLYYKNRAKNLEKIEIFGSFYNKMKIRTFYR